MTVQDVISKLDGWTDVKVIRTDWDGNSESWDDVPDDVLENEVQVIRIEGNSLVLEVEA